jgi:ankyrin repeat protein
MRNGNELGYWSPACVELLLNLGADPNALDDSGLSPLHKASSSPEIIKLLLGKGAGLSVGKTNPLFTAIQYQDLQALTVLLNAGVSANITDLTGSCPVHYHVKDQARTALFCACFPYLSNRTINDSVPVVKLLIDRGADLFAPLNERESLIHYVFEHAEYPIVCAFLDYADKIDLNRRDQLGRTVLLAACNWTECLPGYRHQHWDPKATAPVVRLLDFGVDVLAVDNDGRNALHHILDNPDIEEDTILQLLEYGDACQPLLRQQDTKGLTPLHCALRTLRPTVCEKLMSMGCNLLEADPLGATALHHIASQYLRVNRRRRAALLLREHPKEYYEGCLRLWQKFLKLGGDINVRDRQGSPPLFYYISSRPAETCKEDDECCCHVENFSHLFAEDAVDVDVFARNEDGETALHVIARRESPFHTQPAHDRGLFAFMVGKGVDPLAEDGRGRSSLDIAAACGKDEILDLFQYHS